MKKIVIVEDVLKRGLWLVERFRELQEERAECGIEDVILGYFNPKVWDAEKEVEEYRKKGYEIEVLSLWNFEEVLDNYYEEGAVLLMDFLLENDGSDGMINRRVNIRYARGKIEDERIWFYTAASTPWREQLKEKVGEDHVLNVLNVNGDEIELDLEDNNFMMKLSQVGAVH